MATPTLHYPGAFYHVMLRTDHVAAMEAFCEEALRLVRWTLKHRAEMKTFEYEALLFGWSGAAEKVGVYVIQIIGEHPHQWPRIVADELQSTADERGYQVIIRAFRG